LRMLVRPRQSRVLHHKFDIHDTTGVLLEIELAFRLERSVGHTGLGYAGAEVVAHLRPHVADLAAQALKITLSSQHRSSHTLEILRQQWAANQHPRPHQRLVFPGPGFFALIALKGAERTDQQPRSTGWPQ